VADLSLPAPSGWPLLLRWAQRRPRLIVVWSLLVVLVGATSAASPTFRQLPVELTTLKGSVFLVVAAIGEFTVVAGGGIDLSVASVATLSGMVGAAVMGGSDAHLALGLIAGIGIGVGVGLVNAALINYLDIPPFVATFGMYYILQGVAYTYSVNPVGQASPSFYGLFTDTVLGVPALVIIGGMIWLVSWYLTSRTKFGRHIFAVGGDAEASRLAGVRVARVRVGCYVLCGAFASLAGLLELTQTSVGTPDLGDTLLLTTITAVVLGGVSLLGGEGSVGGVVGGALFVTALGQALNSLQIEALWQELIQGLVTVGVLAVYRERMYS